SSGGGAPADLSSTALLSLGTLTGRLPDDSRTRLTRQLEADLKATSTPREQRVLLLALDNARFEPPAEQLAEYLRSQNPDVREAAVALAGSGRALAPVTSDLIKVVAQDEAASVRAAALDSLLRLPRSEQANAVIAAKLAREGE